MSECVEERRKSGKKWMEWTGMEEEVEEEDEKAIDLQLDICFFFNQFCPQLGREVVEMTGAARGEKVTPGEVESFLKISKSMFRSGVLRSLILLQFVQYWERNNQGEVNGRTNRTTERPTVLHKCNALKYCRTDRKTDLHMFVHVIFTQS